MAGYFSYDFLKKKKTDKLAIDLYYKNMYDWMNNDPKQRQSVKEKATQQGNDYETQLRADAQWYVDHTSMEKILENYYSRQHKTA